MSETVFTDSDMEETKRHPSLGPSYFAGRRFAEALVDNIDAQDCAGALNALRSKVDELLHEALSALCSNAEYNIQLFIWQTTNATVNALLTGQEWAIKNYVLAQNVDAERVRKAIMDHCGYMVRDQYVADLEAENKRLNADLEWHRRR